MTSLPFPKSSGLPRLPAAYRPSRDEVRTYAEVIATNEGMPLACATAYQREAELQLWVWRSENHQPRPRRVWRRHAA